MQFKNIIPLLFVFCFGWTVSAQKYISTPHAEVSKKLGESDFTSDKSFYNNIEEALDFTILSRLLRNSTSRQKLENQEMVTIFAIADEGFLNMPKKSRDSILGDPMLINSILKYLAVPGRIDKHSLLVAVEKNGGKAYMNTLEGKRLGVKKNSNNELVLFDEKKNIARIIATDFYHKNGFFHIIDGVIFPN